MIVEYYLDSIYSALKYLLIALLILILPVLRAQDAGLKNLSLFEADLQQIRQKLKIPGMSLLIQSQGKIVWEKQIGYADLNRQLPVRAETLFPVASISKTFASVLVMQLAEQELLRLSDTVKHWLPDKDIPRSIQIQHLLSHTSQANVGENFDYSYRYAWLGAILEKATGKNLKTLCLEHILDPLQIERTIPGLGATGYTTLSQAIASPYFWKKGKVVKGNLPRPGLRATTGLVSTPRDLAKFSQALDTDTLVSRASKEQMWAPFVSINGDTLPYGQGWFVQKLEGYKLVWHYGQEDGYASLLLKIPAKNLTFIALANSNPLSEHGQIIHGNLLRSALGFSFLKNFVMSPQSALPPLPWSTSLDSLDAFLRNIQNPKTKRIYRDEIISRIMMYSFLAEHDDQALTLAQGLIHLLVKYHPEVEDWADLPLLHALSTLTRRGVEACYPLTEKLIQNVTSKYPHHPHALYLAGAYFEERQQEKQAIAYYEQIGDLPNLSPFWYTVLSVLKAGRYYVDKDPAKAKKYLQNVVNWGWNIGGAVTQARQLLYQMR